MSVPRKARADGAASRSAILNAAAQLATTRGLEALSIGDLAEHIGMSKSGLYAHFRSKEELEIATVDTAAEIFTSEVLDKVPSDSRGLTRISALVEAFLDHLARRVFPGGCFFATVAAQVASNPGRVRDRVLQMQVQWVGQFVAAIREAKDAGDVNADTDVEQVVFELTAMIFSANFAWVMSGDEKVLANARTGVKNVLQRVSPLQKPSRVRA